MKNILFEIFINGRIPFVPLIKKIFLFLSVASVAGIFLFPEDYRNAGQLSWSLLVILLAVRPFAEVFPRFRFFRGLLPLRKEAGILCGALALAHVWGFFFLNVISIFSGFFDAYIWDYRQHFFWGMIGFLCAMLLLVTSNIFSIRLLKRWWKRLHRLAYPFIFVVAIHIAMIRAAREGGISTEVISSILPIFLVIIIWIASLMKLRIPFQK